MTGRSLQRDWGATAARTWRRARATLRWLTRLCSRVMSWSAFSVSRPTSAACKNWSCRRQGSGLAPLLPCRPGSQSQPNWGPPHSLPDASYGTNGAWPRRASQANALCRRRHSELHSATLSPPCALCGLNFPSRLPQMVEELQQAGAAEQPAKKKRRPADKPAEALEPSRRWAPAQRLHLDVWHLGQRLRPGIPG